MSIQLLPGVADALLAQDGMPATRVTAGVTRQGQFRIFMK